MDLVLKIGDLGHKIVESGCKIAYSVSKIAELGIKAIKLQDPRAPNMTPRKATK